MNKYLRIIMAILGLFLVIPPDTIPVVDPVIPVIDPIVDPVVDPPVDPPVVVDPAIVSVPGNRVLIVYESSDKSAYPADQLLILNSQRLARYLDENCAKGTKGNPDWRIWDKDVDTDHGPVDPVWKEAMALPRTSIPWLIVTNGKVGGYTGPLPANVDDVIVICAKEFK